MKFKHNENIYEIEKTSDGFLINDELIEVDFSITDNHLKTNYKGKTPDIYIAKDKDNVYLNVNGEYYEFKEFDEDDDFEFKENQNQEILRSQMPGSVVDVLVEVGQEVNEGEPVIIIEAMKMEATLYSSIHGTINQVNCKKGEQIDADIDLIVIEKSLD